MMPPIDISSESVAAAASLADWDRPASDVSNAAFQDALADSLVADDESVRPMSSIDIDSASDERVAEEWPNEQADFAEAEPEATDADQVDPDDFVKLSPEEASAWSQQQEPEAQVPQELTPQATQEAIQELEAFVQNNELDDPVSAKDFASEFCEAFETDVFSAGVNAEGLGSLSAQTVVSAYSVYDRVQGDLSQLPQQLVAPGPAKAFSYSFLRNMGISDPRSVPVDHQLLAEVALRGDLNIIDTYRRLGGKVTHLDEFTDPQVAEDGFRLFMKAFGIEGPVNRSVACKFADARVRYVLRLLPKLEQISSQPTAPSRASRSARRAASGNVAWRSNRDIFDAESMELYRREHGRL